MLNLIPYADSVSNRNTGLARRTHEVTAFSI